MLLLKLLSPKKVPNKLEWGFRHKLYHSMLKALSLLYFRGKIDDNIVVNEVEVTHGLYDEWFENELRRFNIGINMPYHFTPQDCLDRRWYHRFRIFNWKEAICILHHGKKCLIVRNSKVDFAANMPGMLMTSSDDVVSIRFKEIVKRGIQENPTTTAEKSKPRKIHFKETVNFKTNTTIGVASKKHSPKSVYTQHKGFEENDIF